MIYAPDTVAPPVSDRERLNWLQIVRAGAALLVATYHASGRVSSIAGADGWDFAWVFQFGNVGVDLFFVISGFIIAYVHHADIGRPRRLAAYAYKRATRIYPPLWVVCALVMPLYFIFPGAGESYARDAVVIVKDLLLIPSGHRHIIGVAWTLIVEAQFYVMFALLILSRRAGLVVFAAWFVVVVLHAVAPGAVSLGPLNWLRNSNFLDFFGGVAVASLFLAFGPSHRCWTLPWLAPTLLGVGCLSLVLAPYALGFRTTADARGSQGLEAAYTVASMLIVAGAVALDRARRTAPAFGIVLGNATYSIYLVHAYVGWIFAGVYVRAAGRLSLTLPPEIVFVAMMTVMIGVGLIFHRVVEKPLLRMCAEAWARRTPRPEGERLPA